MSDPRLKRVNKEILDCQKDKASGITIQMVNNSATHLVGSFKGPIDTPYEGGHYEVDIVIPEGYPFSPVKMKFITKVYHPNISSQSGAICLDILKDAWSPVLTLKSTLISLQSLLCDPAPDDPQDAQVANHYKTSRESFNDTARHWAQAYAGAPIKEGNSSTTNGNAVAAIGGKSVGKPSAAALAGLEEADVKKFVQMGFPEDVVVEVLGRNNYRGANRKSLSDDQASRFSMLGGARNSTADRGRPPSQIVEKLLK